MARQGERNANGQNLPAVGVDKRLWDCITANAVNWIADILLGGDDDAEGKQNDDRYGVVQLENGIVNLNAAGL